MPFLSVLSHFTKIKATISKSKVRTNMQTLQIQLPDFIQIDRQEIQMLLATKLYEKGTLSVGQAAQLAGFSKRTFMELWLFRTSRET
jgi:predicted HTH domain antitoxin